MLYYIICMNQNKATLNKKMIERLIIIHKAIKSGMYPNSRKLQSIYCEQVGDNVGIATISRDIETLRTHFNAPLEYDHTKKGYYYSAAWSFALNSISAQEAVFLSTAKTLLSSFQGNPLYDDISKVIDLVTSAQETGNNNLLKRIAIPPTPRFNVNKNLWDELIKALQDDCVVEFDYTGRWDTSLTHRRVHPYQLLLHEGVCYLYGFAEERDEERLFVLTRIKNLQITNTKFKLPDKYEFSARCGGGRFGSFASDDRDKYVIDFYRDARQYVKDRKWADDQKITDFNDEDRTRIEFSGTQFLSIQAWVLSQGGNAIPREPEWLVDEWKNQISQMVKNTKK